MAGAGHRSYSNQQVPSNIYSRWQNVGDSFEEMLSYTSTSPRVEIAKLTQGMARTNIEGVIIQKGRFRCFNSKKDNMQKFVIDITIQDSPRDAIIVSCWGQMKFIKSIEAFRVGSVVSIENILVQSKPTDGSHDRFKPFTTSPYFLNLYESRGTIKPSLGNNDYYQDLMRHPIKAQNNFTIFDLNNHCTELQGQHISVLALVKQVGKILTFTSKSGQELKKREVKLLDDTEAELTLIFWNEEWIHQASQWEPKHSIIYASDVKVSYDNYRKKPTIVATDRTVITHQPKMREATLLARYAETIDCERLLTDEDNWEFDLDPISLGCIKEEMCVQGIRATRSHPGDEIYCILWAVLTHFNIDDPTPAIIAYKCSYCHKPLTKAANSCDCSAIKKLLPQNQVTAFYNMRISLTDNSGTLENCTLSSKVTEKMLGEAAEKFEKLTVQDLEQLKWKYLLERYRAVIQVRQSNNTGDRKVRVLSLETIQSDHLFEKYISYQRKQNI